MIVPDIKRKSKRLKGMRDIAEMTCTVAKIWDEEVGGRPDDETKDKSIKILKRKWDSPITEDDKKKKRCSSPFRPWTPCQEEPLSLISKKSAITDSCNINITSASITSTNSTSTSTSMGTTPRDTTTPTEETTTTVATTTTAGNGVVARRNYRNMTRERRIEANARERTRVHTITAAFETLRKAVPAYSHNQKLSKLSVLRVAASYILTLSRVLGEDYSLDGSCPSISDCVQSVTNAIQMEGKLKKRKDE